jgi:acyl-CoA synthetase (AMP-forming)/AMP-acid ligase II
MRLTDHADERPDHPACIDVARGFTLSFGELERRSRAAALLLRAHGLGRDDAVCMLVPNRAEFFELAWAAQRTGLRWTPLNTHLNADDAAYIVGDTGATVIVADASLGALAIAIAEAVPALVHRFSCNGAIDGFAPYEAARDGLLGQPLGDESEGIDMLYSSGTTGRPKGVRFPLPDGPIGTPGRIDVLTAEVYGGTAASRFLCPAPLYHAAPLRFSMAFQRLGATVVLQDRFDASQVLAAIDVHAITHTALVPTMFSRLLKLPAAERLAADTSSLRHVIHGAAPCPPDVKRAMIDWWGPVLDEYYAATEGVGYCSITSEEWLARPGSVGRPVRGRAHVLDEDGRELGPTEVGLVYFETDGAFEYHNDAAKTASVKNARGWVTLGDIGWVDRDGYLYLTDREADVIISGGVNIYPREAEDVLITHPAVDDVGVIGEPDAEMGERTVAVVKLRPGVAPSAELSAELLGYCTARLSAFKCPRRIDFATELPRLPTGKLQRRVLRAQYRVSGDDHGAE